MTKPKKVTLTVYFSPNDEYLLDKLAESAALEKRALSKQVLYILEQYFKNRG